MDRIDKGATLENVIGTGEKSASAASAAKAATLPGLSADVAEIGIRQRVTGHPVAIPPDYGANLAPGSLRAFS